MKYPGITKITNVKDIKPILRIYLVNNPDGGVDVWQSDTIAGMKMVEKYYWDVYNVKVSLLATPSHCIHLMTP